MQKIMFFIIEKSEQTTFDFSKNSIIVIRIILLFSTYKMETQKIVNLLNDTDNESSKFATRNSMLLMIKIT